MTHLHGYRSSPILSLFLEVIEAHPCVLDTAQLIDRAELSSE